MAFTTDYKAMDSNAARHGIGSVRAKFNEGDVVSRKIGGPLMTVEQSRTDGFIAVVWFDAAGTVHRDAFAPVTLNRWRLETD